MKFLRRLTLVLAEVILLVILTVVLVLPEFLPSITAFVSQFDMSLRLVVAGVIDLLLVAAMISQLRAPTYRGDGLVVQAGDSMTSITTESVRHGVMKAVGKINDISQVDCKVESSNGEAELELEVVTSRDDIHIPSKQKEIDRAIKQVVVKQMGVRLHKAARVNIRLASDAGQSAPILVAKTEKPLSQTVASAENSSAFTPSVKETNGKPGIEPEKTSEPMM